MDDTLLLAYHRRTQLAKLFPYPNPHCLEALDGGANMLRYADACNAHVEEYPRDAHARKFPAIVCLVWLLLPGAVLEFSWLVHQHVAVVRTPGVSVELLLSGPVVLWVRWS